MHGIKINSPKKHTEKIAPQEKISTSAKNEANNLVGMVVKSVKPKISPNLSVKSHDKNGELNFVQKLHIASNRGQLLIKNSVKRKDEKSNRVIQKKVKTEVSIHSSDEPENLTAKKLTKYKSAYPKTYICKFCCRRFYTVELLKQHSVNHGSKPTHVCYLCNHQTASFSALMTHYLKHSSTKGDKIEKIYAKSKADFSNIQFNIFSRPKSSYQCSNCKLSFNIKSKYDSHTCSSVIKKNEYNCAYCGHISLSIEEYRTHVQSHSETPFMCSHCKYKVQTKKQLDKHQEQCKKRLNMNNKFKCHKCSVFTGKNKTELILHLKTCHIADSSYICSNCHSEFQEKKNYDDHLSICQSAKKEKACVKQVVKQKKKLKKSVELNEILCDTCGNAFKSKSDFEEHEKQCVTKMANATNEINKNLCDVCGNAFKLKSEFEEHKKTCLAKMANATNKVTSSLFSTNDSSIETTKIDKHVETYSNQIEAANEKKLDIAVADNHTTRRSTRLVKRKSSFIDDDEEEEEDTVKKKPIKIKIPKKQKLLLSPTYRKGRQSKNPNNSFLCSYCDFTFCSKSTLLRHKRMHSGNPWYICQYCGKFFFRKDVYIRHEMNVHSKGSKTIFCCYYCKLCFEESPPLKEHVLEIHKDSAFLPTKHRRPRKRNMQTPKISDLSEEEEIKKSEINYNYLDETIETVIASANNVPETLPSYKCSVCSQTFKKASDIEIHMLTHPDTLKREKCDEILNISGPQNVELSPNTNESVSKVSSEIFVSAGPCPKSTFIPDSTEYAVSSDHDNADVLDNNVESNSVINEFSNLDNLVPTPNFSNISESLACKLCLKQFSNKKLLEAHSKTLHRLVDWYQCLVCSACGPKQEMQEHMFMHMFKVGTFVVNSNSRNFDSIISCLQLENGQKKINENTIDFTQDAILRNETSSETTNLIHEDELPPLREFGICSCIEGSLKPNQEQDKIYPEEETTLENESNKVEEIKDSQEKSNSDNEINMSSNESELLQTTISCSVDNSTAVGVGDICSKKSEDIFEVKESLKIDETNSCEISFSNQGKEDQSSSFQSEESGSDENEGGKFSQLRYLLQKPSALKSSENKITLYPFSQTQTPGFTYESSSPLVKYSCSMEDSNILPLNLVNPSLNLVNTIPDRQSDVDLSNKNNPITNLTNFKAHLSPDTSQSISTCLKFDINQSRSEFSENVTTSSQNLKSENCELDKTENIFKSCPSQSTILDFSDLIQHSFENSSPSEDNLFAYSTPVKQVDVQSNNNREGVRTPDCSDMANYDCSAFSNSVKCKDCNVLFEDYEQMNHQCFASKSDANSLYVCKSKDIFPSLNYPDIPNQNKIPCIDSATDRKLNILSPQKSSETFASSCVTASTTSEMELERHPSSEYVQNVLNPVLNNSKCTKCHRTFRDLGELMKHSLTCLKSLYFKTPLTNDSAAPSGCLQSLLTNRTIQDSKSSFDFSLNSPLSFNTVSAELSQSSENLLNHSFDS